MGAYPYRTSECPSPAERDDGDLGDDIGDLMPIMAAVWIGSVVRVAGAAYAAVHAGTAFGAEATLAMAALVIIPALMLRRRG
jgi:hypothetical protein